ncbi:MAG: hypothetical protein GX491_20675 [Chloroflexi bacterium]|nr:hypothetical protein [Chloroflexota bacterium]
MPKIDVTPELVGRLINQVAPLVEFTTRWSLDLQTLKYRVLPKNRGYEEIVLARFAGVGLPVEIDKPRSPGELLIEYMLENNILGAYEPSTQEILVVRENVDESNLDGLRLILAHELVHRGQQTVLCRVAQDFILIPMKVRRSFLSSAGRTARVQ